MHRIRTLTIKSELVPQHQVLRSWRRASADCTAFISVDGIKRERTSNAIWIAACAGNQFHCHKHVCKMLARWDESRNLVLSKQFRQLAAPWGCMKRLAWVFFSNKERGLLTFFRTFWLYGIPGHLPHGDLLSNASMWNCAYGLTFKKLKNNFCLYLDILE